jgi:cobyrinic acid a,c-diamide synthase
VIDGSAMAQTFGALAHGLASFQPDLPFAGVLGNRVGSVRHGEILRDALPASIRWYGALPRRAAVELPSRHLGLVQAEELADLDARLDAAADALAASAEVAVPAPVAFAAPAPRELPALLRGVRIGVARDAAFAFLYQANLDLLRELGAELRFFSPLADSRLPEVDSLYLPGGYPELHLAQLEANQAMAAAIRAHHGAGKPIHAECGGMLYLLDRLTDQQGVSARMLGLLPGTATLQPRLTALALQEVALPEGRLRGHTFHHSALSTELAPIARGECPNYRHCAEAVYRQGRLSASYIHFYLASAPVAAAELFRP